jgi:hypothetical protein
MNSVSIRDVTAHEVHGGAFIGLGLDWSVHTWQVFLLWAAVVFQGNMEIPFPFFSISSLV